MAGPFIYHSEYGQDRWLYEIAFSGCRNGTFVEAGALNGILHSNTLFFERELGWRGVLIEANPTATPILLANRPLAQNYWCALGDTEGTAQFCQVQGALFGWSSVIGAGDASSRRRLDSLPDNQKSIYQVPRRPLADVLYDAYTFQVDYLSLDVEGSEMEVLRNFPFEDILIGVIGVEDNDDNNAELARLLHDKGYSRIGRVGVDNMWMHSTYRPVHLRR